MSLTSASEAERQAERLRRDLIGTLDQIVDNLTPANLAAEAMTVTRAHTPEWLKRYWMFARSPAGLVVIGGAVAMGLAGTLSGKGRIPIGRGRGKRR